MIDHSTLLKNILDNPENIESRLVYADWLMEQGDPRGEFIRLQCALSNDMYNDELRRKEQSLIRKYRKKWLKGYGIAKRLQCNFENGFIKELHINAKQFIEYPADLFSYEPIERLYIIHIDKNDLDKVLRNKVLNRISAFHLRRNPIGVAGMNILVDTNNFINLKELDLSYGKIGVRCAPMLERINSGNMPKLEYLKMNRDRIGDRGFYALLNSESVSEFSKLELQRCDIELKADVGIQLELKNLKVLDLSCNILSVSGLALLFRKIKMPNLEELVLSDCDLGDDIVAVLNELELPKLTDLCLGHNRITNKGHKHLSNLKGYGSLERITINKPEQRYSNMLV